MKAEFSKDGALNIIPENETETVAIRAWIKNNISENADNDRCLNVLCGTLLFPAPNGFDYIDLELETR